MKNLILIVIGFTMIFLVNLEADEYILKAPNEECKVVENINMGTVETNCIEMVNSKKKHIYCTKTKKVCKTKDEIWDVFDDLTHGFSIEKKELLSGISKIKRWTSYPSARKIIVKNGWIPNDINDEVSGQLVELRKIWQELEDCSGAGAGYCNFIFHDTLGNQLTVTTAGEWDINNKQYGGLTSLSLVMNSLPYASKSKENTASTNAFKNAKKDCENGEADRCSEVASYYEEGTSVKQDYFKAEKFYHMSCNGGYPWGCISLGDVYKKEKKFLQAKKVWNKSCDDGYPEGCTNLGTLYSNGQGITQNYVKAKEFFTKGCNGADGGDTYGCLYLGLLYAQGKGVKQDYAKAKELLDKTGCDGSRINMCKELKFSCDRYEVAKSYYDLGNLYRLAKGEIQSYSKAKEFYVKSCDNGYAKGCVNIGVLYYTGKGVQQSYTKAKKFYLKSCNKGLALGCTDVGVLYYKGKGVQQSYTKAKEFYTIACDGGDGIACFNLGELYLNGKGVIQSYPKAKKFYGKACDNGHTKGCYNYKEI